MPTHQVTQTLRYAHREDDIATLGRAIDLLGKRNLADAIEVLQGLRDRLMDAQKPVLKQYDPREDHPR